MYIFFNDCNINYVFIKGDCGDNMAERDFVTDLFIVKIKKKV